MGRPPDQGLHLTQDAVNLLSRWLAGHVSPDELREGVADLPEAAELRQALEDGAPRPVLQRLVRETLEDILVA